MKKIKGAAIFVALVLASQTIFAMGIGGKISLIPSKKWDYFSNAGIIRGSFGLEIQGFFMHDFGETGLFGDGEIKIGFLMPQKPTDYYFMNFGISYNVGYNVFIGQKFVLAPYVGLGMSFLPFGLETNLGSQFRVQMRAVDLLFDLRSNNIFGKVDGWKAGRAGIGFSFGVVKRLGAQRTGGAYSKSAGGAQSSSGGNSANASGENSGKSKGDKKAAKAEEQAQKDELLKKLQGQWKGTDLYDRTVLITIEGDTMAQNSNNNGSITQTYYFIKKITEKDFQTYTPGTFTSRINWTYKIEGNTLILNDAVTLKKVK